MPGLPPEEGGVCDGNADQRLNGNNQRSGIYCEGCACTPNFKRAVFNLRKYIWWWCDWQAGQGG